MKKAEVSVPDLVSNLLVASSVLVVVTSVLLGDNLVLVVTRVSRECGIMVQQYTDYLVNLLK